MPPEPEDDEGTVVDGDDVDDTAEEEDVPQDDDPGPYQEKEDA